MKTVAKPVSTPMWQMAATRHPAYVSRVSQARSPAASRVGVLVMMSLAGTALLIWGSDPASEIMPGACGTMHPDRERHFSHPSDGCVPRLPAPTMLLRIPPLAFRNHYHRRLTMAWIELPIAPELGREFPGILGPMTFRPETARPINELVNILLRGESTLTPGERELIATHVSWRNDCYFCQTIHGAVAAAQLNHNEALVQKAKTDWMHADVSPKLKALLNIAGKVQQSGKSVTAEDIAAARHEGATDREIHDTVL